MARGLAALSGDTLSPVQVDYLIAGYFGWVGRQAVLMADWATRPLTDRATPERIPVVSDFKNRFLPEPGGHSKYLTRFYEVLRSSERRYADLHELVRRGDTAGAQALLEQHREALMVLKPYRKAAHMLNDMNQQLKVLSELPTSKISDAQRKQGRTALQAAKLKLAQTLMEGQPAP